MNRETILAALAAIACTLGIFLTADSFIQAPKLADVMKRKYADMDRLLALQDARAGDLAAVAAFDQLPDKKPAPLAELAAAALPGARPTIRQRESRPAADGWSVRSAEVTFDAVALPDLARFLAKAEETRPPWRLVEFNATALEQSPAGARVSVVLEALEKR